MNKNIYNKFIEAEELWWFKIEDIFNSFFAEFEKDYKKMAELMIVVKNRVDYWVKKNDEKSLIYLKMRWQITFWSHNKLKSDEFEEFCKLADNYCIAKADIK